MSIRIGANIASLRGVRQLDQVSTALDQVFARLASGQRINRASDDAAGLAIAESLNADRRIFNQAIRNLSDGISLLNIADAVHGELIGIVTRIQELAEQSANGTYTNEQRKVMNQEAQSLSDEYFRVARSATFNGMNLFDGSFEQLSLQAGYGEGSVLSSELGGQMGDGTVGDYVRFGPNTTIFHAAIGDLNNDGNLDMVGRGSPGTELQVLYGDGTGDFDIVNVAGLSGDALAEVELGDVNNDGLLDILAISNDGAGQATIMLNDGNGSFTNAGTYTGGNFAYDGTFADTNNDGNLDLITSEGSGIVSVRLGGGDGSFGERIESYVGANVPLGSIDVADVNGDGILDVALAGTSGSGFARIALGDGSGGFNIQASYSTESTNTTDVTFGDVNGDGWADLVTTGDNGPAGGVTIRLNNGDGTFGSATQYETVNAPFAVTLGDLNSDGHLDLISAGQQAGGYLSVRLNDGTGQFGDQTDYRATSTRVWWVGTGDFNNDSILDIASAGQNQIALNLGNSRSGIGPLLPFSLETQADALQAMAPLQRKFDQITQQRSVIGSFQSRVTYGIENLKAAANEYASAESRIRDADIAQDAAELTRLSILKQIGARVIAQANIQPDIALSLLS